MSRRTSKKLSAFTCSSCCRVLMLRAAYPLADKARAIARCRSEARLPPLPCACTIIVVSTGGLVSDCQSAARTRKSVDRLDRKKPQRSARQRLHVVGKTGGGCSGFVFDVRHDLRHAR